MQVLQIQFSSGQGSAYVIEDDSVEVGDTLLTATLPEQSGQPEAQLTVHLEHVASRLLRDLTSEEAGQILGIDVVGKADPALELLIPTSG